MKNISPKLVWSLAIILCLNVVGCNQNTPTLKEKSMPQFLVELIGMTAEDANKVILQNGFVQSDGEYADSDSTSNLKEFAIECKNGLVEESWAFYDGVDNYKRTTLEWVDEIEKMGFEYYAKSSYFVGYDTPQNLSEVKKMLERSDIDYPEASLRFNHKEKNLMMDIMGGLYGGVGALQIFAGVGLWDD